MASVKSYAEWCYDAERWLAQRSGSSKKERDQLPGLDELDSVRRRLMREAQVYLDGAINLTTLIRLEQGK